MASKLFRIFVYGTLKRGEPNYHLMCGEKGAARLLAEAKLTHPYPLVVGKENGIPYMLPQEGKGEVSTAELSLNTHTLVWRSHAPSQKKKK